MDIDRELSLPDRVALDKMKPEKRLALQVIIEAAQAAGGWDKFKASDLRDMGVPRATLFRWIAQVRGFDLGAPSKAVVKAVRKGRVEGSRPAKPPPPPPRIAKAVEDAKSGEPAKVRKAARVLKERAAEVLPPAATMPTIRETVAATVPLEIIEQIQLCLAAGRDVMERSRGPDGAVRNSKMLLLAAEQLRRSLDTAVKLQEAISDGLQIEQFHKTIMEEIAKIDPAVAARIAARLLEVNAAWAGRNGAT